MSKAAKPSVSHVRADVIAIVKRKFIRSIGRRDGYTRCREYFHILAQLTSYDEADEFWKDFWGHPFAGYDDS